MKRGLLIIDRGSREPEAVDELRLICGAIKERGRYEFVDYCFLEVIPPFLDEGMDRALKHGLDELVIVPYFLYPGRKEKIAVTEAIKYQKRTNTRLIVTKPMSMHPSLVRLVEDRIDAAVIKEGLRSAKNKTDVLIIGHGSKDPNARTSLQYVVDGLRETYRNVNYCFLEIEQPDIAQGVRLCKKRRPKALAIVLYFLHEGAHVKTDIYEDLLPALKEADLPHICITKHLGADKTMIQLIEERAREVESAD